MAAARLPGSPERRPRESSGWSCALAHLPSHVLALVPDALALVGLGLALLADVGGNFTHLLLGGPTNDDPRRLGNLELDSVRRLDGNRVRVAQRQLEVAAAQLSAVTDALDLQALLEAVRDTLDHVGHQGAGQAVQGAVLAAVGGPRYPHLVAHLLDVDLAVDALGE